MPKKRSSFRQKAREIFHSNSASAPSLPEMDDLSAEEMARLEREQEEEDLAEFRRQEEEAKAAQEAAEKSAGTEAEAAEAGSLDGEGGKKKSSKDRFKEREVSQDISSYLGVSHRSGRDAQLGGPSERPGWTDEESSCSPSQWPIRWGLVLVDSQSLPCGSRCSQSFNRGRRPIEAARDCRTELRRRLAHS